MRLPRGPLLVLTWLAMLAVSYLFGAMSYSRSLWPMLELRGIKQALWPTEQESTEEPDEDAPQAFDEFGRLVRFHAGKLEVSCPKQDDDTLVLLLIGQSNTANWHGQRYTSKHGDRVINFFDGTCYVASSPLLGTSGYKGEAWTLLGNKLIESETADRVILVPAGIGRSSIDRWRPGGDLNAMLEDVVERAASAYRITHVLWHQGETDFGLRTPGPQYTESFLAMVDHLRQSGVTAPMFASVATRCGYDPEWTTENPVALTQRSLPGLRDDVLPGVDTDALLGLEDRYDDCHFSGSGQEKFAEAWLTILQSYADTG